jgi:xylitol oxidase
VALTNWAGNLTYRAAAVHHPDSVAAVQDLVARLPRVRALGTRHSFSPVADCPGGDLVSLDALPPEITVDPAAMTVSVTAGTRYGELAAELHAKGFALHNTGSLPHISVAGATATGTHGSGDANGILSTAIVALEVVTADGSLHTVRRDDPAFPATAVGLGLFGVITRVVLEIQPTYQVRQDVYIGAPWDGVLEAFDEIMAGAYSVSLMGDPGSPTLMQIWQKTRVGDEPPAAAPESRYGGRWYDDADLPPGIGLNPRAGVVGPWSERLPHFRLDMPPSVGGDELQTEYFVARRHAVDALAAVRALGERISPHLHAMEVRTVAADDLWLSPAHKRDSVTIGFTWRKHPGPVHGLIGDVEAALGDLDARPHWGKLHRFTADDLARAFPRLADAIDLARARDPGGKFASDLCSVGGEPGAQLDQRAREQARDVHL